MANIARLQRQKDAEDKKKRELQFKILRPGDAIYFPKPHDSLAMHYIGYLSDGTMFDNSYNRGQPIYFILGGGHVIPGLEQVCQMLSKGEKARVTIPPHLAYGDRGYPPVIPPLATLTYEVELLTFTSSTHMSIQELHQKNKPTGDLKPYVPKKNKVDTQKM
jgi:FKBP-type peptidyl-prolyl cis-trans isomerase